jgi:hypothetical protein
VYILSCYIKVGSCNHNTYYMVMFMRTCRYSYFAYIHIWMFIMLAGPLVYCALLFSFDFYLTCSSIYVYMSDLVERWSCDLSSYQMSRGSDVSRSNNVYFYREKISYTVSSRPSHNGIIMTSGVQEGSVSNFRRPSQALTFSLLYT